MLQKEIEMDRNTLTGLVLIGLLLPVFTIINKPSEEELKQQEAEIAKAKEAKAKAEEKDSATVNLTKSSNENIDLDQEQNTTEKKTEIADSLFTRKTDKFTVDFSTKGGQISSMYLNDYKTYESYSAETVSYTHLTLPTKA